MALGNLGSGVEFFNSATGNTVGGVSASARNIIADNGKGSHSFAGVYGGGGNHNLIEANYIGTDVTGLHALGSTNTPAFGLVPDTFAADTIGGTTAGARNVISGGNEDGIHINNSNNMIQGNYIGLDATGTRALGNFFEGILAIGGSNNLIGGTVAGAGNVISGNGEVGLAVELSATAYTIQDNLYIGTALYTGTVAIGNARGIQIQSGNNTIGGTVPGSGNLVSGNAQMGIYLVAGVSLNVVEGNYVGTDIRGLAPLGNAAGIVIDSGSFSNTIGGTTAAARNIISGNGDGVVLTDSGTTGNTIEGNFIGTDVSGFVSLGNTNSGITFQSGAAANTIGGNTATPGTGAGNVISGNMKLGVFINGANDNNVLGNLIGLTADGSAALANGTPAQGLAGWGEGIEVNVATNNVIGGPATTARNIVSGNSGQGVYLVHADATMMQNNYVGLDITGQAAIANSNSGVAIYRTSHSSIIGNVISGNTYFGGVAGINLAIDGGLIAGTATANIVQGNLIGTNAAGTGVPSGLLSIGDGIVIKGGASGNTIGGTSAASANVISGNDNGVWIGDSSTTGNLIEGNYIGTNAASYATAEFAIPTLNTGDNKITIGPDGNLWFTERSANKIGRITPSGVFTEFTIPTPNSAPEGITTGPDGDIWFTEHDGGKIGRITPGGVITEFTSGISIIAPFEIVAGADGNLWFTDETANKIGRITTSGVVTEFTVPTPTSSPGGIAIGPDGNVWFVEYNGDKIGRITPSGSITEFAIPTSGAGGLGIVAGSDGNLWFTENNTNKIGRITTGGLVTEFTLPTPGSGPYGIVAGPDGNLWFAEAGGNKIGLISTSGTVISEITIPTGSSEPGGIAVGPQGTIWFTEIGGSKIGRISGLAGTLSLPNGVGVLVANGATSNSIGSIAPGAGNVIAHNSSDGVAVVDATSTGNAVRGNEIFANGGLGIDLGGDGVTANDHLGHVGPNDYQDFPALNFVGGGASTNPRGILNARPNTTYTIDFYASSQADPTGYGEGQRYLGTTLVTTDATGRAVISATFGVATSYSDWVTATATDPAGNTSEFGQDLLTDAPPTVSITTPATAVVGITFPFTPVLTDAIPGKTYQYSWSVSFNGATVALPDATFIADTATDEETLFFNPQRFGSYVVAVTVTDSRGGVSTATSSQIMVSATTLGVTITGDPVGTPAPFALAVGQTVTLDSTIADPRQTSSDVKSGSSFTPNYQYAWSVTKDGLPYTLPPGTVTNAPSLTFTPTAGGLYFASLAVHDGTFAAGADGVALEASAAPSANVIASPGTSVAAGTIVTLQAVVTDLALRKSLTYFWTITPDNGRPIITETDTTGSFAFNAAAVGNYVVGLTVVDDLNRAGVGSPLRIHAGVPSPTVTITGAPAILAPGVPLTLTGAATDADPNRPGSGSTNTYTLSWSALATAGTLSQTSGSGTTFSFTASAGGLVVVTLTATDQNGFKTSIPAVIQVSAPAASLTVTPPSNPSQGQLLTWSANLSQAPTGTRHFTWSVFAPDGTTSAFDTGANPTLTLPTAALPGRYELTVTATIGANVYTAGAPNPGTLVQVPHAAVAVSIAVSAPPAPRTSFQEADTVLLTGTATEPGVDLSNLGKASYLWTVTGPNGFSQVGVLPTLTVQPLVAGTYTATLTVRDFTGGAGTATTTFTVQHAPPKPALSFVDFDSLTGTTGFKVTVANPAGVYSFTYTVTLNGQPYLTATPGGASFVFRVPLVTAPTAVSVSVLDSGGATGVYSTTLQSLVAGTASVPVQKSVTSADILAGTQNAVILAQGFDTVTASSTLPATATVQFIAVGAHNIFFGGPNINIFQGDSGSNAMTGGSGANTFYASGNDTLKGGSGANLIVPVTVGATRGNTLNVTAGSGPNTIDLSQQYAVKLNLTTTGTAQPFDSLGNSIQLSGAFQSVVGSAGADTLTAASGTSISGGGGSDLLAANNASNVTLSAASGLATLQASGGSNVLLMGGKDTNLLTAIGVNNASLIGGSGNNDSLVGGVGSTNVSLIGGSGSSDSLIALGGNVTLIGGSGNNDSLVGGVGSTNVSLIGGSGSNDSLIALGGNVSLIGGSGSSNSLIAGAGSANVSLVGGSGGNDSLIAGASSFNVSLIGGSGGSDSLIAGAGSANVTLIGGSGNSDSLVALGGNVTLVGGSGTNDSLIAGAGALNVSLVGGSGGSDSLIAGAGSVNVTLIGGSGSSDSLVAGVGSANVTLIGGSGNSDSLVAGAGSVNVTLIGGSGNSDSLVAGAGSVNVTLIGGSGSNDSLVAGTANVTLIGGSGNSDSLIAGVGSANVSLIGGSGSNDSLVAGVGSSNISLIGGSGGNDSLVAGTANVTLIGGSGNSDSLIAGVGSANVSLIGGSGSSDSLFAGAGSANVSLIGGSGNNDSLVAGVGSSNVSLIGGSGSHDSLIAGAGSANVSLIGGSGSSDSLVAGVGSANVSLIGGSGSHDSLLASGANVTLIGGSGNSDSLVAGVGAINVSLLGGSGSNDSLFAGANSANISLLGGSGSNDSLVAATGAVNLVLVGGSGSSDSLVAVGGSNVSLIGGSGAGDILSVVDSAGALLIGGFGNGDSLAASGASSNVLLIGGFGNGDSLTAGAGVSGAELVGGFGDNTWISLTGVNGATAVGGFGNGDSLQASSSSNLTMVAGYGNRAYVSRVGGNNIYLLAQSGTGDSLLSSGGGANISLVGGSGDELYVSDNGSANVSLLGGAGRNDTVVSTNNTNVTLFGGNGDNDSLLATGSNNVTMIGGLGNNDTLTAVNVSNATLFGGAGNNDSISSSGGDSILSVGGTGFGNSLFDTNGTGDTLVNGGNQTASLTASGGTEIRLFGGGGSDFLSATGGAGMGLFGESGDNTYAINGSAANPFSGYLDDLGTIGLDQSSTDQLEAGTNTIQFPTAGKITIDLSNQVGGASTSTNAALQAISTGISFYLVGLFEGVVGSATGDDTILGNALPNLLVAGAGNTTIMAGSGDTTLVAGSGNDLLVGGSGRNTFVFPGLAFGHDTISQTNATNSDTIDLSQLGAPATLNLSSTSTQTITQALVHNLTLTLSSGSESDVIGSPFGNTIIGNSRDNHFTLTTGNNSITTGSGLTTLKFNGSTLGTNVVNAPAPQSVVLNLHQLGVPAAIDLSNPSQSLAGGSINFAGATDSRAVAAVVGTTFGDTLMGNSAPGAPSVSLIGGGGRDSIVAGSADDYLQAGVTQVVLLDFDTYTPLSPGNHIYTQSERDAIEQRILGVYAELTSAVTVGSTTFANGYAFTQSLATAQQLTRETGGEFVTIYFNAPPAGGQASEVDFDNTDLGGSASIDASLILGYPNEPDATSANFIAESAGLAEHELGHLAGLRHTDSFGPIGSGAYQVFVNGMQVSGINPDLFYPEYQEPTTAQAVVAASDAALDQTSLPAGATVFAAETALHVMGSPASVGISRFDTLNNIFFGEREAIGLAFDQSGVKILAQTAPHSSASTAEDLGALPGLVVPNTLAAGSLNAGKTFAVGAEAIVGHIGLDPTTGNSRSDWYSFAGHAGDFMTFEAISSVLPDNPEPLDTILRVVDSAGNVLASNDDELESHDSLILDFKVPADGRYFVQVDTFSNDPAHNTSQGNYVLYMYSFNTGTSLGGGSTLIAGAGHDTMYGGNGNDLFRLSPGVVTGSVSIIAGNGADVIDQTAAPQEPVTVYSSPFTTSIDQETGTPSALMFPIALASQAVDKGDELHFSAGILAPGRSVLYSLSPVLGRLYPTGATIRSSDGDFNWAAEDQGTYQVQLIATASDGTVATLNVTIAVNDVAPALNPVPAQTAPVGAAVALHGSVVNSVAGDAYTFAWTVTQGTQTVATFTGQDVLFNPGISGAYAIRLTVTDTQDNLSSTVTSTVTVSDVAPTVQPIAALTARAGDTTTLTGFYSYPGSASDLTLTWTVTNSSGQSLPGGSGANFTFTAPDADLYTIVFAATTSTGLADSTSTTLTASDVAPTATPPAGVTISRGTTTTLAFTNPFDPGPAVRAAGFRYSFALLPTQLATSYASASSLPSTTFQGATAGTYTVYERILDKNNGFTDYTTQIVVTEVQVAAAGGSALAFTKKTASAPLTLATFTDPGGAGAVSDYAASIDWGDGSTSLGAAVSITLGTDGKTFSVVASHTYVQEGPYTIRVAVGRLTLPAILATDTATVSAPALVGTGGINLTATKGADTGATTVATFSDPTGPDALSSYSALIAWGDNTTSPGIITLSGSAYTVQGNHVYLTTGTKSLTITLRHLGSADASVTDSMTVLYPALVAQAVGVAATRNASTGLLPVATFTDPAGADALSAYRATISWGDNTTSSGASVAITLGSDGRTFTVFGTHSYVAVGTFATSVSIQHGTFPTPATVVGSSATVTNPAVMPTFSAFSATAGVVFSNRTVATFVDPSGGDVLGSYSVTINWGDGTTTSPDITTGTITGPVNNVYSVTGSHTYSSAGNFSVTVTIGHTAAPAAAASGSIVVSSAAVSLSPSNPTFSGGLSSSPVVASFTDPSHDTVPGDFTATITWGDGNWSTGVISSPVNGVFSVTGTHTYFVLGTAPITVSVAHGSGAPTSVSATATIGTSIFALNPTLSGSVTLSGSASLTLGGALIVDSNSTSGLAVSGAPRITAGSIRIVGGYSSSGSPTLSPSPTTHVATIADPLAALPVPANPGGTVQSAVIGGASTVTLNPGLYSQITISGSASVHLNPGVYIIKGGGLTLSGAARLTGSGVLIYNAGSSFPSGGGAFGGIAISGSASATLSPASTGVYAGITLFQSRDNNHALSFSGAAQTGISGFVYAQTALVTLAGSASTLKMGMIVDRLNSSGAAGSSLVADGSGEANSAGELLSTNLFIYVSDPIGYFTPGERARIDDAISSIDAVIEPYNVTVTEVTDPAAANLVIDADSMTAFGDASDGVLALFDPQAGEITVVNGWNWYDGADPNAVGTNQFDFQTVVTHEIGHALGLGHNPDPASTMYHSLLPGLAKRTLTDADLNIGDVENLPGALHGDLTGRSTNGLLAPESATVAAFLFSTALESLTPIPLPNPVNPLASNPAIFERSNAHEFVNPLEVSMALPASVQQAPLVVTAIPLSLNRASTDFAGVSMTGIERNGHLEVKRSSAESIAELLTARGSGTSEQSEAKTVAQRGFETLQKSEDSVRDRLFELGWSEEDTDRASSMFLFWLSAVAFAQQPEPDENQGKRRPDTRRK